ncbi:MAG: alpha/beta hydrolase fold domain-containing protein, partial [Rhizobiales bacterium]|nr:alpha/beta hydrolase fold domain-containing protein [Hyphomicrobiales bacterium]
SGALAAASGLCVVSVDYRLAPEHVAPAPIADGLAAIAHVLAADAGNSVVLCGDSAGAAIALAVAAAAKARISGIAACYGSYGLLESNSLRQFGTREDGLDVACLARIWSAAHEPNAAGPYAIGAISNAGSAPVYLLAGGREPLLDDSIALAQALRVSGRLAGLDVVAGEGHGFLHAGPAARAAFERLAQWIGALPPR